MIATLDRRLARLEAASPPPPSPPDRDGDGDDWPRFLRHSPPPVLAYLDQIAREAVAAEGVAAPGEGDWFDTAHPAFADVVHAVRRFADKDLDAPLGEVQHAIPASAFLRLQAHHARNGYGGYHPGTTDATWRDTYGLEGESRQEQHGRYTGRGWLTLWRERGATDPAPRSRMGIHAAEAALLATDPPDMHRP
jgi:hypothetical protein